MSLLSYAFSYSSILLSLGAGLAIIIVGWRVGLSHTKTELIKVLKIKNEILEEELIHKEAKITELQDLLKYHDSRYESGLSSTTLSN